MSRAIGLGGVSATLHAKLDPQETLVLSQDIALLDELSKLAALWPPM